MEKIGKRMLGWLLCICMVLSYLPAVTLVANAEEDYTGPSTSTTITTELGEEITITVKTKNRYALAEGGAEVWYASDLEIM